MKSSAGQIALVTGASQGIGNAITRVLHECGVRLLLTGRSIDRLEAAVAVLGSATAPAPELFCADLSEPTHVDTLATAIQRRTERLDILIHCAAVYRRAPWLEATRIGIGDLFATNFFAPVQLTQQLMPQLRTTGGTIVFINSSIVNSNAANVGGYAASKHALRAFADSLRAEVSAEGIRVLSVFPGRTATPMQEAIFRDEGRNYRPDRLLQPEDVAKAVVGCLSLPDSAEVTDLHIRPSRPG